MPCKYGIERGVCLRANGILNRLEIRPLSCPRCRLEPTVAEILGLFKSSEKDRYWVRSWLKQMEFDSDLLDVTSALQTGFRCPVISETISIPCALSKCRYHIDYPWSGNCLLAYLHQQETEQLSVDEVAYLYQRSVSEVKTLVDDATAAIRSKALDVDATEDTKLSRKFRYFVTDQVCCVCESAVDPKEIPRSLKIESAGAVYCSKECRDDKPPRLVELEIEKGLPIAQILDWTFRRYKSLSLAEQSLGIPRWLTNDSCKKFLNRPIEFYFSSIKNTNQHRRSALIRRTWHSPHWVNVMLDKLRSVRAAIFGRSGPPSIKTDDLKQQLNYVTSNM